MREVGDSSGRLRALRLRRRAERAAGSKADDGRAVPDFGLESESTAIISTTILPTTINIVTIV